MPGRWMPSEDRLEGTNDLMLVAIESQCVDGRPADGSDSEHLAANPSKVMVPLLFARMKQRRREAGPEVAPGLPRTFA